MPLAIRKLTCIALLVAGVALWGAWCNFQGLSRLQVFALLIVACIALIPSIHRAFCKLLDRIRHPSPTHRAAIACGIFIAVAAYLIFTAILQHRPWYPRSHDEHMHLLQMRMLSTGRLWTATPAMADFFETFHTVFRPVYASIYWPGTSLLYVWEIWLNTPYWLGPMIVASLSVSLVYRIVTELLDDSVAGLLTAICLLGVRWFRFLSFLLLSHGVIILLGLALIWAYLNWRKRRDYRWAIFIGILTGWAAITRPIDALCFAVPVGLAMLWSLRCDNRRRVITTLALVALLAAPFLSVQLVFNKAVTGSFIRSPYQYYMSLNAPGLVYGSSTYDPDLKPHTTLPQKLILNELFHRPELEAYASQSLLGNWLHGKIQQLMNNGLATPILLCLVPVGLFGLFQRGGWVLWGMLPCYIIGYSFFPFLLTHYCAVPAAALGLSAVLGMLTLADAFPRARAYIHTVGSIGLIILTLGGLHEVTGKPDDPIINPLMKVVAEEMPKYVKAPAVVLFRYTPYRSSVHEEPVYNINTVNPDDAPVIRAHDLGERNHEIFEYYAQRQPERRFYLFDRAEQTIYPLGTAKEMASQSSNSKH